MQKHFTGTATWILVLGLVFAASVGWAQDYPTRPIRFIVPVSGGNADVLVRQVASKLKERTGWTTVVENRSGADFASGILATTQAPADGYTVLEGFMSYAILPHTRKHLSWDLKDLLPVARIGSNPSIFVLNPSVPATNLAELVAYSKANPGKLSFGGPALGTNGHLSAEFTRQATGLNFVYVPYRDGGGALLDLAGGRLQIAFASASDVVEYVKSGRMHALMVLGQSRNPMLPDVPTAIEATGNKDMDTSSWFGFFVRTGTPAPIVAKLEHEIVATADTKDIRDWMTKVGQEPLPVMEGSEVFRKRLDADYQRWGRVVQEAKIQPE